MVLTEINKTKIHQNDKADIVDMSTSIGLTKVETEAVVNGFMETVTKL